MGLRGNSWRLSLIALLLNFPNFCSECQDRRKVPCLATRIYIPQWQYCVLLPINAHFPHYSNARLSLNIIHLPQLQLNPEEKIGTTYSYSLSTIHHILRNKQAYLFKEQSKKKKKQCHLLSDSCCEPTPCIQGLSLLFILPLLTPEQHTLSFWVFSHKRDVSRGNYNVNNPFWTLTLLLTLIFGEAKKGRIKSQSITYTRKIHIGISSCVQGSGCSIPHSAIPYKDPLLANSPLLIMATPEEEMYSSLTNLFLHTLITITDLVMIASAVFSCKGDHVWQYQKLHSCGHISNDESRVSGKKKTTFAFL